MSRRTIVYVLLLLGVILSPLAASADNIVGRVTDENGDPLVGALVKPSDKQKAQPVVTDLDGRFRLIFEGGEAIKVEISYIGYITETIILRSSERQHTVRMRPDVAALEEVVVTATRTPKSLKDVPVITRVIGEDEIAKADATNIQDLLTEELPGLEFGYAMSQETSLNMNGFGGNAVLFLVDGERLAGETMDNVDYNRLNLDNVGRVEVVKGASSALYGANAVGGVVNIISRETSEPWRVNVNSRYRSAGDEWRTGADLNFNSKKWNSNTNLQYTTVNTIKLTDVFDTQSRINNVFGGKTLNAKERLTYRLNDNIRFIARGGYFTRESNRANYDDHYKDYTGGLRAIGEFKNQTFELSYSYDQYDKSRYIGGVRTHDHDYSNRQHIVHGLYTHFFGRNALTAGADYMHDYLTTYQFVNNNTHTQYSVDAFAQFDYNPLDWLNIIASLREDYFSASKNAALTSRVATMFKLQPLTIRASYAGGFRAPTLKEMYMDFDMAGIQMIYGNPDLKPERSHNFNIALERTGRSNGHSFMSGSYSATVSGYYNYYDRRITTTDYTGDADREDGAIYTNEDGVKVMGIDLSLRYRTNSGLGAMFNYNYLHTAGNTIDSQFTQPRPHSATWRIDYERQLCSFYKLYVGLSGRYLSKPKSQYETDGAYSMWKFNVRQLLFKGINVNFTIDNLLNYKPKVYYWNSAPTTGRTWSVGVSLDIDTIFR